MIIFHEIKTTLGTIRGFEHKPTISNGQVFIQHGYFSSNHVGPNRLYWQIAEQLCKNNFTVYRFACYGTGDSDGEFAKTSYQLHLENYTKIIQELNNKDSKTCFIGHSMGTSIAVHLATVFNPNNLILISPSIGPIDKIENLFNPTQLQELNTTGKTERKGLLINKVFMDNSQDASIFSLCKKVKSKVQLHYGFVDELYNFESVERVTKLINGKLNLYKNADHNFLDINSRTKMINSITEFLLV